jgi:hypothetical protein
MPRPDPNDSDDLSDREFPDDTDTDPDNDFETVPCPYCREPIFDGADLCPHCKSYLSAEDAPRRYPWWLIAGVAVCLVLVLLWVL